MGEVAEAWSEKQRRPDNVAVIRIEGASGSATFTAPARQWWLRSCSPRPGPSSILSQLSFGSDNHCADKMLGIDYASSDEEEAVPATKPEV